MSKLKLKYEGQKKSKRETNIMYQLRLSIKRPIWKNVNKKAEVTHIY